MLTHPLQSLFELLFNGINGAQNRFPGGDVVRFWIDSHPWHLPADSAGERIKQSDSVDFAVKQLYPHRLLVRVGRKDIDHIAAHPVSTAAEIHIITSVLKLGQAPQESALVNQLAASEVQTHL